MSIFVGAKVFQIFRENANFELMFFEEIRGLVADFQRVKGSKGQRVKGSRLQSDSKDLMMRN